MVPIAFVAGVAIVAVTVMVTATRYRDLPERIPIHFGLNGRPNGYGPRPAAWLLVGVQLLFAGFTFVSPSGTRPESFVVSDAVLALCLIVQLQILSVAANPQPRLDMRIFWVTLAATAAAAVLMVRLI